MFCPPVKFEHGSACMYSTCVIPLTRAGDSEGCSLWRCKVLSTLGRRWLLWWWRGIREEHISWSKLVHHVRCWVDRCFEEWAWACSYPFCCNLGYYLSTSWETFIDSELHPVMKLALGKNVFFLSFCDFLLLSLIQWTFSLHGIKMRIEVPIPFQSNAQVVPTHCVLFSYWAGCRFLRAPSHLSVV